MAAGDHTRNRLGNCSIDRKKWPCPTVLLEASEGKLTAADELAAAVHQLRAALDGPTKEFGIALFAAFDAADAYRQVRGEQVGAEP
jgi:hypothetical protein